MMVVRSPDEKHGDEYLEYIFSEIDLVSQNIGTKKEIKQLHWGGGTPTFLSERQMERLFKKIERNFRIAADCEISVEADPRRMTRSKVQTLSRLGFNRISLGVQDFDPLVQQAVNRIQPFDLVKDFTEWCRAEHFHSINFDLIYGLPQQTVPGFKKTLDAVIGLNPDRIALYSFAYLPWLKKHQGKFSVENLPSRGQKLEIFLNAREQFLENGYRAIAMDHFALSTDELAKAFNEGTLYRNFMGYTTKPADEFLGLGVSAIGFLQNTFVQNCKVLPEYYRALKRGELPIERGKILTRDDQIRQWVIRCLMCRFMLDKNQFLENFGEPFDLYFSKEALMLDQCEQDGLIAQDNQKILATELGKIFIRNVCMSFDWYLQQKNAERRFSKTV